MRRRPTLKAGNGSFPCESQLRRVTGLRLSNWDASWTPTRNGSCCCDRDMAHTPARRRLRPASIRNVVTMRTQTIAPMPHDIGRHTSGGAWICGRTATAGCGTPGAAAALCCRAGVPRRFWPPHRTMRGHLNATTSLSIRYPTTWAYARQPPVATECSVKLER